MGRSNRTAYAFLMYQRNTILKEEAEKRLKAIREFTDLGSGFKIAMRDLEIRGAGNLLGAEQSGHMEAVGYDMYCKMLNDAVMEMKGTRRFEDTFETTIDLQIDAFIPSSYVASENQKLDLYRRIAQVENEEEADDMIDELVDRYGEPPAPVSRLLEVSILKSEAHSAFLTSIEQKGGKIRFIMSPRATRVRVDQIDPFVKQYRGKMKFETGTQPAFVLRSDQIAKKDILDKVREVVGSIKENLISEEEPVQI
ncbi:MAG: TRCF domain-containing protein [Lachnospiraceae bacterium]|nr:TRCF domain-containing protein [Lachnospiraceae bacterium]